MIKTNPSNRYTSSREQQYKEAGDAVEAVQGECETNNRLKIKMSLLTCPVCMQTYNINNRQPMIVCPNNHTYCKQCADQCMRTNRRCPQCRAEMRDPIRNRDIYELVESNMKLIEQKKMVVVKEVDSNQAHLSISRENALLGSFWVKGERIMKIENNRVWQGLVAHQILPRDKQSSFTVGVLVTQFCNIKVGVAGAGYLSRPGLTCPQAVLYHLADGKILEGGRGIGSQWRGQGQPTKTSKDWMAVIECRVNPIARKVSWYQDQMLLGEGKFSQFLLSNSFTAYIMLCHKGDAIELNS